MKKRKSSKLLAIFLSITMLAGLMPTTVLAETTATDLSETNHLSIMPGTSHLQGGQADSVFFGNYAQSDVTGQKKDAIKWRVLSNTDGKLFLISDQNLDVMPYHYIDWTKPSTERPADYPWETCDIRTWLNDTFYKTAFSDIEKEHIAVTTNKNPKNPEPWPEDSVLQDGNDTEDQVFLLSYEEAGDTHYFTDDQSRLSLNSAYVVKNYHVNASLGNPDAYWLRSNGHYGQSACNVTKFGKVDLWGSQVDASPNAIRPALNLTTDDVLFCSAVAGSEFDGKIAVVPEHRNNPWRFVLKDDSRNVFSAEITGEREISYTNAKTGSNEYISAMIMDDETGAYTHYGRLKNLSQTSDTEGTIGFGLPFDMTGKTLYIFNEQYNGDDEYGYAGAFVPVSMEKNAYNISYSGMSGLSSDGADYRFPEDTGAYTATLFADDLYMLPETISVTMGGEALNEGTDYTYDALSGKINIASITGDVVITANGTAKTWGLVSSITSYTFTEKHKNYTAAPEAQTVTLTNTGNQPLTDFTVTLSGTQAGRFTLDKSKMVTSLKAGESTTFTVQPNTGLGYNKNKYKTTVQITGEHGINLSVSFTFNVLNSNHIFSDVWSSDKDNHWHECTCGEKKDEAAHKDHLTFHQKEEPTCTAAGSKAYYSCECGKNFEDALAAVEITGDLDTWKVITANGHTPEADDGDCTTPIKCSVCGEITTEGFDSHTGGTATCRSKAVCTRCNKEYGEKDPDNHTGTEAWVQTETTHKRVYNCCDKIVSEEAVHDFEDGVCTECQYPCVHEGGEATCTQKAVCTKCGSQYGETDPENHKPASGWTWEDGKHYQICENGCGVHLNEEECSVGTATCIAKAECSICHHEYGDYGAHSLTAHQESDKTCTENGNRTYWSCPVCGKYYSDAEGMTEIEENSWVIPASHEYEWVNEKPAGCTENGIIGHYHCEECGKNFSKTDDDYTELSNEDMLIPAAHTFGSWIKEIPAACTQTGIKGHMDCEECGKHFDEFGSEITDLTIPAPGHNLADDKGRAAACTEDGLTAGKHCTRCDYKEEQKVIRATGHTYKNGKCTVCGAADPDYVSQKPTGSEKPGNDNPLTGENSNIWLWMALLLVSCGGVIGAAVYGRKQKQ